MLPIPNNAIPSLITASTRIMTAAVTQNFALKAFASIGCALLGSNPTITAKKSLTLGDRTMASRFSDSDNFALWNIGYLEKSGRGQPNLCSRQPVLKEFARLTIH